MASREHALPLNGFTGGRLGLITLSALSLVIVGVLFVNWRDRARVYHVTLAAGSRTGESYAIGKALETVMRRQHPNIRLSVRETGGTAESLALLERGEVDLAAAQADVPTGSAARLIAVLYEDTFQLIVHTGSGIRSFPDLRGRRVALPTAGGQYQSFAHVAAHFGLSPSDCRFVGSSDDDADRLFLEKQADAVFRVRALGNPAIARLVRSGDVEFVPIPQGTALQIKLAAFRPAVIPQGAYLGEPPMPPADLASVGVQRTLLAHRDTSGEVVEAVTALLMDGRQELADAIDRDRDEVRALLAGVKAPDGPIGLGPPVHEGAQSFYDRDKPAFVEQYADFVALLLTIAILLGSWGWELHRWITRKQKDRADRYTHQVVVLITRTQAAREDQLPPIRRELFALLTEVVCALDEERISEDSFQSFRVVWQIALDLLRERAAWMGGPSDLPVPVTLEDVGDAVAAG